MRVDRGKTQMCTRVASRYPSRFIWWRVNIWKVARVFFINNIAPLSDYIIWIVQDPPSEL